MAEEIASLSSGGVALEDITIGDIQITAGPSGEFTTSEVSLEQGVKKRVPRRILHFSDGTLEEYSTDEEEEEEAEPIVDTQKLTWPWWFWHYVAKSTYKLIGGADFCGEKLAWFFGITSPKYQYYIDQYEKIQAEKELELAAEEREQREEKHALECSRDRAAGEACPQNTQQNAAYISYDNSAVDITDEKY